MATEEWQLLISGLTLLLTPIASAVVVGIQLRKSHSWWLKQQQYLLEKERIQRKFDLYERTAHILARLNSLLLEQQVFLFSRNKCEYMLHHCLKPDQVKRGIVNSEYQRYRELAVKQNEKIREKKAEFQQIGFLGRAYFGLDFEKHTMQVASSLKQAEQQLVPLPELIQTCNSALQQGKTLDDALSLLDPIFDQRWEALNPKDRVAILLETIYRELTIEKEGQSRKGEFSSPPLHTT